MFSLRLERSRFRVLMSVKELKIGNSEDLLFCSVQLISPFVMQTYKILIGI